MKPNNIICFRGNTKILTPRGDVIIQDLKPNDEIISFNQESQCNEIIKIEKIAYSYHTYIAKMVLNDSTIIEMTIDHPIWICNKGWAAIESNNRYNLVTQKIEIGDNCLSINIDNKVISKRIDNITIIKGYFKMYIISGGKNHNFIANGILVHDENLTQLNLIEEEIEYKEIK